MVDGGVKTMVPVWIQKLMGAEYILAVNLGQREYNKPVAGLPQIISRTINILTYETSDTEEKIFADILLFPGVEEVPLDGIDQARAIIKQGRLAMQKLIPELKRGLK
jgi:NTE family protein